MQSNLFIAQPLMHKLQKRSLFQRQRALPPLTACYEIKSPEPPNDLVSRRDSGVATAITIPCLSPAWPVCLPAHGNTYPCQLAEWEE